MTVEQVMGVQYVPGTGPNVRGMTLEEFLQHARMLQRETSEEVLCD